RLEIAHVAHGAVLGMGLREDERVGAGAAAEAVAAESGHERIVAAAPMEDAAAVVRDERVVERVAGPHLPVPADEREALDVRAERELGRSAEHGVAAAAAAFDDTVVLPVDFVRVVAAAAR